MHVPTMRVKAGDGYLTINVSDFDPAQHERYEEPTAAPQEARTLEPEPMSDAPTASVDETESRPRARPGRTERA